MNGSQQDEPDYPYAADDLPDAVRDGLAAVLDLVADGHDVAMFDTDAHLSTNEGRPPRWSVAPRF